MHFVSLNHWSHRVSCLRLDRVETQRKQYHAYKKAKAEGKTEAFTFAIGMDDESRIARLEEIGFAWALRSGSKVGVKNEAKETSEEEVACATPERSKPLSWDSRLQQLKEFKAINGHCLVPNTYPSNKKLGIW